MNVPKILGTPEVELWILTMILRCPGSLVQSTIGIALVLFVKESLKLSIL